MADAVGGTGVTASVGNTDTSGNTIDNSNSNTTVNTKSSGTTDTSTNTASSTNVSDIIASIMTNFSNVNGNTTNAQNTTTGSKTAGGTTSQGATTTVDSADPQSLQNERDIMTNAIAAAKDPTATNALVQNILNQSAVTFGSTRATERSAGLYDSSTLTLLEGYAKGQAVAQSSKAVLDYQTTEQQIAQTAAANILAATKTSTTSNSGSTTNNSGTVGTTDTGGTTTSDSRTSGGSQTNTDNNSRTDLLTNAKTGTVTSSIIDAITNAIGYDNKRTNSSSTTESGSLGLGTIICTELHVQGKLSTAAYHKGMSRWSDYPTWGWAGYYLWAAPCVRHMKQYPSGRLCKFLQFLFTKRASGNWAANFTVELLSATCGLYLLATGQVKENKKVKA